MLILSRRVTTSDTQFSEHNIKAILHIEDMKFLLDRERLHLKV